MARMRATLVRCIVVLALASAAAAQVPDCKLAQSPREHAICSDARLRALDAQISAAYTSLLAQLSAESAALVQSDQSEWLRWIDLICPAHGKGVASDQTRCLYNQYGARARDLKQTAQIGSAVIFPRARFLYRTADQSFQPHTRDYPGFGYGALRWPQIDLKSGPLPPSCAAFNEAIQSHAGKFGAGPFDAGQSVTFDTAVNASETIDAAYTIDAANDRLLEISLFTVNYLWVSGAAPLTTRTSFLWWLDKNRELTADDIFASDSPWRQFVPSVATARLQDNTALKPLLRGDATIEGAVQQSAVLPSNWILTHNGLRIIFPVGMVAANPAGMPRVFISWNDLNFVLGSNFDHSTLPPPLPKPR